MALNPGDTLLNGQYEILRTLGRGGFGHVYLANDRLLGEQVAIKELIPDMGGDETVLKRFLAEARATIRLTHEHIVRTYNVFTQPGPAGEARYYIVMEYMPGGSLADRLRQEGALAPAEAARVTAQVCEGLGYAHERGVVHCDLKPGNILFATDPLKGGEVTAKVADFGIAHFSERLVDRTWHTTLGFVAGTLPYMSPEQIEGVRDDARIDIYALGAVLYRMLTGRSYLEFDQRTTPAAQVDNVARLRSEQPPPPSRYNPRVPRWLDTAVLKALTKDAGDRFATAQEMRRAVLSATEQTRLAAAPPGSPAAAPAKVGHRPPSRSSRRQRSARPSGSSIPRLAWFLGGGALLLCAVVAVVAAILLANGGQATPGVTLIVVDPDTPVPSATLAPSATARPLATDTPQPPPTETSEPSVPTVLYEEDFQDPASGWGVSIDNDTEVGYQSGEYRIAIYQADYVAWGHPDNLDLWDFSVEVDARAVEGPLDNNFGLLVRLQPDSGDFYWFQISSDGFYSVDLYQDGEFSSILPWEESDVINQGLGVTNHLRVTCSGYALIFEVNGVRLTGVHEERLGPGNIGLAAGSFDEPGVVVHFDNLRVSLPDDG
jgi:serine/threonine protein kinase